MKFGNAGSSVWSVLRSRPATVLPIYLAGTSVGMVAQTVPIVGVVVAYILLGTARIRSIFSTIRSIDFSQSDLSNAEMERLGDAMTKLFTPEITLTLLLSVVGAIVVFFVARAIAEAAQVHTATAALRNETAIAAGVTGAREDSWTFLKLSMVRMTATLLLLLPSALPAILAGEFTPATVLLSLLVFLLLTPVLLVVNLLFLFVPQAIVIDGVGVRAGIRRSARFGWNNKARVAAYLVVVIGLFGMLGFVSVLFQFLGVSRVLGIVLAFGLFPTLSLLKTALYLDDSPLEPEPRGSIRGAFGRGLTELTSFVFGRFELVLIASGLFAGGIVGGWVTTSPFALTTLQTDVSKNVFGSVPFGAFVTLTVNNWLVAISAAFAGLVFGIPAVVTLLFNGLIVGGVVGLLPDTTLAIALIAPHGIIEIPALAVAGALGLHLGGVSWSYVRGSTGAPGLAAELVRAYYILLGLLPVFIVAAFIEAFLTWWVATSFV
ncbi:stage II sporulation protein M [Haladaptatus caseinilyticus]|uniref:stage II sporulation protein M n=1 Tax=Haladaptatus caseinilyticus TaxID=2993314 RepID=UPI00224B11FD|nr:stage II sporulation protein M [Haladaptatus caseinilyticus]